MCCGFPCGSAKRGHLCINAHFADNYMERQLVNLAVRYFPGSHTAENTAKLIRGVLGEYDIPMDRCAYACTDNASTMECSVREHLSTYDHTVHRIHCAAHWLQLGVLDALEGESPMQHEVCHISTPH